MKKWLKEDQQWLLHYGTQINQLVLQLMEMLKQDTILIYSILVKTNVIKLIMEIYIGK